jgi:hypothetical protein
MGLETTVYRVEHILEKGEVKIYNERNMGQSLTRREEEV